MKQFANNPFLCGKSHTMQKGFSILALCLLISLAVSGSDLVLKNPDALQQIDLRRPATEIQSPAKAAMLSATLPGLGQIYNGKYWKVPVIYAGFGTLIYFVDMNTTEHRFWREAWLARVDGNPNTTDNLPHSTAVLERAMNYYRRNLEITYLLSAALYLLNILDASVDAHLMNFDVGEDLRLGMQPRPAPILPGHSGHRTAAHFTITYRF